MYTLGDMVANPEILLQNWFNPSNLIANVCPYSLIAYGALGVGTNVDHYEPTLVEELEGGSRDSLVSGNNFVALLSIIY